MRSREIIEILADVVAEASKGCELRLPGQDKPFACPDIHYVFGNAQYVKDNLDELSKSRTGRESKFPLIALFTPFNEERNDPDYHTKAKVRVLIACSSSREWNNGQRLEYSFRGVLRPIYIGFLQALKEDGRLDFGYDEAIRHGYSENYTYGRYGAYTDAGEEVSEPIDAINITNLELKVKLPNCRTQ